MRNKVRLFIGNREVDFKAEPEILFNYTQDDLTNPTVVKNSFTKTITIDGNYRNNRAFGHMWNLERYQSYGDAQTGIDFNPSKKVPFELYVNGVLYEKGYVRLDEVRTTVNSVEYDITLFGGLGEFFYILSYDDDGEKLKLSDLKYMYAQYESEGENEFDFRIDRSTIKNAWYYDTPDAPRSSMFHYINFAPCYNGIPDALSADRVLINFNNQTLDSAKTVDNVLYTSKNGYSLGTLPESVDEWGVRDLRTYLQRPVLRMSGFIEACKAYASKKGFSMDLDRSFFVQDNPYYDRAWITLPMLSEIDITGVDGGSAESVTPILTYSFWEDQWYNCRYRMSFTDELQVGVTQVELDFTFLTSASTYSQEHLDPISGRPLYTSAIETDGNIRQTAGYAIQLIAMDGDNAFSANTVAGSNIIICTSDLGNDDHFRLSETDWQPYFSADYSYSIGLFNPLGDGKYAWSEDIHLTMQVPNTATHFFLAINAIGRKQATWGEEGKYANRRGSNYTSNRIAKSVRSGDTINTVTLGHLRSEVMSGASMTTYLKSETAGYSGAKLTKKLLLDTEGTPADYLLSFCKMFGLYFYKHPYDNIIHITTRDKFYDTGNTKDLTDMVDYSGKIRITPLTFDTKWLDMKLESVGGDFAERYENTYGNPYGIQRINTGYNFNADSTNLFEDNVFKGAVEGTQMSKYYLAPAAPRQGAQVPYYIYQGFKYDLYNNSGGSTEVDWTNRQYTLPQQPLYDNIYYDLYPKVQFCDSDGTSVDGRDVILFYNGMIDCESKDGKEIPYWLTDDISIMGNLNGGNACWIYTESPYDLSGNNIADKLTTLPSFGRYIINDHSGYVMHSFDFGEPKQMFIPDGVTKVESTVYSNYWKTFIQDMYDVNTRIMECNVVTDEYPDVSWFRRFYWYNNCFWRLNAVKDHNVTGAKPTKMEFIKVQDRQNYMLEPVTTASTVYIELNRYTVGTQGGLIQGQVYTNDGGSWTLTVSPSGITVMPTGGTGDQAIVVNVPSNRRLGRTIVITVTSEDGVEAQAVVQQEGITFRLERIGSGNVGESGGTLQYKVFSEMPWTASTNHPTYGTFDRTSGSGSLSGETFSFTMETNPDPITRSLLFNIWGVSGGTPYSVSSETVTQEASSYVFAYFSQSAGTYDRQDFSVEMDKEGETRQLYVFANTAWSISATSYPPYLSASNFSPTYGHSGVTSVVFTMPANTGASRIDGTAVLMYGSIRHTNSNEMDVSQEQMTGVSGNTLMYTTSNGQICHISSSASTQFKGVSGQTLTLTDEVYGKAIFDDDIATIPEYCFNTQDSFKLTAVYLPETTKRIEPTAFRLCEFSVISIPDGVEYIGHNAFEDCGKLEYLYLPSALTEIQTCMCMNCLRLINVTFGYNVTSIYRSAFDHCTNLMSIVLPPNLTTLGPNIFYGCTSLGDIAFNGSTAAWNAIDKSSDWLGSGPTATFVHCNDGEVPI